MQPVNLPRIERLIHLALGAYLINLAIAVGIAVYQFQQQLTVLTALTVGRTVLSAFAVSLLLLAVRQMRVIAELYQEHCRFLRQMVLVMVKRAVEPDPKTIGEITTGTPEA